MSGSLEAELALLQLDLRRTVETNRGLEARTQELGREMRLAGVTGRQAHLLSEELSEVQAATERLRAHEGEVKGRISETEKMIADPARALALEELRLLESKIGEGQVRASEGIAALGRVIAGLCTACDAADRLAAEHRLDGVNHWHRLRGSLSRKLAAALFYGRHRLERDCIRGNGAKQWASAILAEVPS